MRKQQLTPEDAFGRVIRERRLALGLTQADLEGDNGSGLERSYISRLESGRYQVCLRGILHLAHALNMTSAELMKEVESRLDGVIPPRQTGGGGSSAARREAGDTANRGGERGMSAATKTASKRSERRTSKPANGRKRSR